MTFPFEVSIPLLKDIKSQAPQAICELAPGNASTNLILNRDKPPFDNPEIRRAMMLSLDRKSFIDILAEGQGDIGGAMDRRRQGSGACRRSCWNPRTLDWLLVPGAE